MYKHNTSLVRWQIQVWKKCKNFSKDKNEKLGKPNFNLRLKTSRTYNMYCIFILIVLILRKKPKSLSSALPHYARLMFIIIDDVINQNKAKLQMDCFNLFT
uniref:Uncharacterized protein n=1 Tax=Rhizophagus irregularis (strain DAOM 181602 / DAOM 197198 / MUCL 43194) TaxID=747089 RepID=U9TM54_RHIID